MPFTFLEFNFNHVLLLLDSYSEIYKLVQAVNCSTIYAVSKTAETFPSYLTTATVNSANAINISLRKNSLSETGKVPKMAKQILQCYFLSMSYLLFSLNYLNSIVRFNVTRLPLLINCKCEILSL